MLLYRVFYDRLPGEEGTTRFDDEHGFVPGFYYLQDHPRYMYDLIGYSHTQKQWKWQVKLHLNRDNRIATTLSSWTHELDRARGIP